MMPGGPTAWPLGVVFPGLAAAYSLLCIAVALMGGVAPLLPSDLPLRGQPPPARGLRVNFEWIAAIMPLTR